MQEIKMTGKQAYIKEIKTVGELNDGRDKE